MTPAAGRETPAPILPAGRDALLVTVPSGGCGSVDDIAAVEALNISIDEQDIGVVVISADSEVRRACPTPSSRETVYAVAIPSAEAGRLTGAAYRDTHMSEPMLGG